MGNLLKLLEEAKEIVRARHKRVNHDMYIKGLHPDVYNKLKPAFQGFREDENGKTK